MKKGHGRLRRIGVVGVVFLILALMENINDLVNGNGSLRIHEIVYPLVTAAVMMITSFLSSRIIMKLSLKVYLIIGFVSALLSFLFKIAPNNPIWMMFGSVTAGFAFSCIDYVVELYLIEKYDPKHMNWCHGLWGLGAVLGVLLYFDEVIELCVWHRVMVYVLLFLVVIGIIWFFTKYHKSEPFIGYLERTHERPSGIGESLGRFGSFGMVGACFSYNAIQSLIVIYGSEILMGQHAPIQIKPIYWALVFYFGMFVWRIVMGCLCRWFSCEQLIRGGQVVAGIGFLFMMIPDSWVMSVLGILLVGLGCSPIYPNLLYQCKVYFPKRFLPTILGMQLGMASVSAVAIPILFGGFTKYFSMRWILVWLMLLLVYMIYQCEKMNMKQVERMHNELVVETIKDQYSTIGILDLDCGEINYIKKGDELYGVNSRSLTEFVEHFSERIDAESKRRELEELFNMEEMKRRVQYGILNWSFESSVRIDGKMIWFTMRVLARSKEEKKLVIAAQNVSELHKFRQLGMVDRDTGLKNRNAYLETIKKEETESLYQGCVYIDINGLHDVNNRYGHGTGDAMIRAVASAMLEHFEEDECFRIGGDEFVILLGPISEEDVRASIRKAKKRLKQGNISISAGYALRSEAQESMEMLIELADERMYERKKKHYDKMGTKMRE